MNPLIAVLKNNNISSLRYVLDHYNKSHLLKWYKEMTYRQTFRVLFRRSTKNKYIRKKILLCHTALPFPESLNHIMLRHTHNYDIAQWVLCSLFFVNNNKERRKLIPEDIQHLSSVTIMNSFPHKYQWWIHWLEYIQIQTCPWAVLLEHLKTSGLQWSHPYVQYIFKTYCSTIPFNCVLEMQWVDYLHHSQWRWSPTPFPTKNDALCTVHIINTLPTHDY